MDARTRNGAQRLTVGTGLDVWLWFVFRKLQMWGGLDREIQLALMGGALAGVACVCLVPVFWKGSSWQAPIALALLALPAMVLFQVLQIVFHQQ